MARSSWKGKTLLSEVYLQSNMRYKESLFHWLFSKKEEYQRQLLPTIKLHRRSQIITSEILILGLKFKVYNGYDFFIKRVDSTHVSLNLGALVLTRESKVVHKTKLSKEARKNQQSKLNKKKPLTSKKK